MSNLPAELLYHIFNDVPRYSHKQCLTVCKSWHPIAQASLNRHLNINSGNDLQLLYKRLFQEPGTLKGSDIIKLTISSIISEDYRKDLNIEDKFAEILNQCINLKELEFMCINFTWFSPGMYKARDTLRMNNLERIYIEMVDRYCFDSEKYFGILEHCCPKIKQFLLPLRVISNEDLSNDNLIENNPSIFLKRFPTLQRLEISSENPIPLKSILRDCPQLQTLILRQRTRCCGLKLNDTNTDRQELPNSQLHSLDVDLKHVNGQFCQYLLDSLTNLRELTIHGFVNVEFANYILPRLPDTNSIFNLFNTFINAYKQSNTPLYIKIIRFEHFGNFAPQITTILGSCFPALEKVVFKDCNFYHSLKQRNNLILDFGEMNLDCISLDLAFLFIRSNHGVNKVVLEIITFTNIFYYQRDGKWKSGKQFIPKTTKSYSNASAIQKRGVNQCTGVVTIKITSLRKIHLKCSIEKSLFEQNIIIPHK